MIIIMKCTLQYMQSLGYTDLEDGFEVINNDYIKRTL